MVLKKIIGKPFPVAVSEREVLKVFSREYTDIRIAAIELQVNGSIVTPITQTEFVVVNA
jgi:hypothetical protein